MACYPFSSAAGCRLAFRPYWRRKGPGLPGQAVPRECPSSGFGNPVEPAAVHASDFDVVEIRLVFYLHPTPHERTAIVGLVSAIASPELGAQTRSDQIRKHSGVVMACVAIHGPHGVRRVGAAAA